MPRIVTREGQPMLELSRDEVFGVYLSMGHGEEYAERMTRTVMSDNSRISFSGVLEQREVEKFKQDRCHLTSFAQEKFLTSYIDGKLLGAGEWQS